MAFTATIAATQAAQTSGILAATTGGIEVFAKGLDGNETVSLLIETTTGVYEPLEDVLSAGSTVIEKYKLSKDRNYLVFQAPGGVATNFRVAKSTTNASVAVLTSLT